MIKLSIVIPLYNNVACVEQCISSLYSQSLRDDEFEVIIVDDGSTDGSGQLADKLASLHSNMQVVHHGSNMSTGAARNAGMALAQGEYVHFVDADDMILKDSYRYIVDQLMQYQADVIYMDFVRDVDYMTPVHSMGVDYCGPIKQFLKDRPVSVLVWRKIIKRSFIERNEIRWENINYGDDTAYTWNMLRNEGTLLYSTAKIYSYRTNENSTVRTRSLDGLKRSVRNMLVTNIKQKEYYKHYADYPRVIKNFTEKYMILFNRILFTQFSLHETRELFAQCAGLGIAHINHSRIIHIADFIYRHPLLFYICRPLIRKIYKTKFHNDNNNPDFLTSPVMK